VTVPAYTAYFEPNYEPDGPNLSVDSGITNWADSNDHVVWYGHFAAPGALNVAVSLNLPLAETSTLRLTFGKQDHDASVADISKGKNLSATATGAGDAPVSASFGQVTIPSDGVYRFTLTGVSKSGATYGDLKNLVLSGPAAAGAHFSAEKNRPAPSVHLWYQTPQGKNITWFYNEVTPLADPIASYYMACGFTRGYFGMQVNGPKERRIIFSVWNAGDEPKDPSKVPLEDKVVLEGKGDGVFTGDFGNEGTGGHSHLVYMWKTGQTYKFLVSAQPDGNGTIYSGFFYFPEKQAWGLISSWRAPKDGGYLRGLYSFNEDFNGANGFQKRFAEFGNQWVMTDDGKWTEMTTASFTHTDNGTTERLDRGAGVKDGRFFLTNGGFLQLSNVVKKGDKFTRPATGKIPVDILPTPPTPKVLTGR
jgi:hypothetical protein